MEDQCKSNTSTLQKFRNLIKTTENVIIFQMYLVSLPIVFICMIFAFVIMLGQFWCEDLVRTYESEYSDQLILVPSIVYSVLVYVMNMYYRKLATFLTEWGMYSCIFFF